MSKTRAWSESRWYWFWLTLCGRSSWTSRSKIWIDTRCACSHRFRMSFAHLSIALFLCLNSSRRTLFIWQTNQLLSARHLTVLCHDLKTVVDINRKARSWPKSIGYPDRLRNHLGSLIIGLVTTTTAILTTIIIITPLKRIQKKSYLGGDKLLISWIRPEIEIWAVWYYLLNLIHLGCSLRAYWVRTTAFRMNVSG